AFRCGFIGSSRAYECASIFRRAQPGIDGLGGGLLAVERAHEAPHQILQTRVTVGIAIPVAQHDVMLSAEIVVAAILGEGQAVDEQAVAAEGRTPRFCGLRLSKKRTPGAGRVSFSVARRVSNSSCPVFRRMIFLRTWKAATRSRYSTALPCRMPS